MNTTVKTKDKQSGPNIFKGFNIEMEQNIHPYHKKYEKYYYENGRKAELLGSYFIAIRNYEKLLSTIIFTYLYYNIGNIYYKNKIFLEVLQSYRLYLKYTAAKDKEKDKEYVKKKILICKKELSNEHDATGLLP